MEQIFSKILSMGMDAVWFILAVILLRALFRKAPKWIICILWLLVGIRLICPFTVESTWSLVPKKVENSYISIVGKSGGKGKNDTILEKGLVSGTDIVEADTNQQYDTNKTNLSDDVRQFSNNERKQKKSILQIMTIIWITGTVIMLLYLLVSYIWLYRKVCTATRYRDNIWESEYVDSPFIFGIIRPRIYIPYHMNKQQLKYILAHESVHLQRWDHYSKVVAFLILSIYWFHPLVWVSYVLFCRDIELACDERVVKDMDLEEKKEYMSTLLACSTGKHVANVSPLAFGEVGVRERVMRIKFYKKPSVWLLFCLGIACITVCLFFLTNPREKKEDVTTLNQDNNSNVSNLSEDIYTYTVENVQGKHGTAPTLTLDTVEKQFDYSYDVLSSYLSCGSYMEEDGRLICRTMDGLYQYVFEKTDRNTVLLSDSEETQIPVKEAEVDLTANSGADGAKLYYVDEEKIIFGGYFGLFVYNKETGKITASLDLEYIRCNHTQGDDYCDIAVDKSGSYVYLNLLSQKNLYIYNVKENTLQVEKYEQEEFWRETLPIMFKVEDGSKAVYTDREVEKTCILYQTFGYIGDICYAEYTDDMQTGYYPMFAIAGYEKTDSFEPGDIHDIVKIEMRINGKVQEGS